MWWFLSGLALGAICAWIGVQYYRQNARLLQEEKERLEQERTLVLEFMHNLVEEVGEESSREDLYRRIVHAAVLGTGGVSGALYAPSGEDMLRTAAVVGFFPPQKALPSRVEESLSSRTDFIHSSLQVEEIRVGEGLIGEVAQSGKGILVNRPEEDARIIQHRDPMLKIRGLMVVPMYFRKRFLGVIAVANPSDGMGFSQTDFSLMSSLAEQAALAIHNSDQLHLQMERQRLEIDLSLAANIQRMLLPGKIPEVRGLELAAIYQTAQQVGGDMYNVIDLPDGRTGVAIADVSGKGIAASLLMAICQTSLEHIARGGKSPAEVLSLMNLSIIDEIRAEMFVTMIYAIIDPDEGTACIARAGHELPILLTRAENEPPVCKAIYSEGMALGMVPDDLFSSSIEETTVPFHETDLLVLYTDGITERVNADGIEFSTNRLIDVAMREHKGSAENLKSAIIETVESFAGDSLPTDDMTLLILKAKNVD